MASDEEVDMGWTWKDRSLLISLYPSLVDSPVLLNSWPGFREHVATLRAEGEIPKSPNSRSGQSKSAAKK
jgi:hypothetical protein